MTTGMIFGGGITMGGGITLQPEASGGGGGGAGTPVTYGAGAGADFNVPGITFPNAGELQFSSSDFTSTTGLACKAALLSKGSGDSFVINSMSDVGGPWTATLTSPFTSTDGGTTYVATYTASVTPFMYSWEITI